MNEKKYEVLEKKVEAALLGGGQVRIENQHKKRKMDSKREDRLFG